MPMRNGKFVLQNQDFYKIVADHLDCGLNKGQKIALAVIKALKNLIKTGEPLFIDGLGTFSVVKRAPNRYGCYYFKWKAKSFVSTPERWVVVFKPTEELEHSLTPKHDKAVPTTFKLG